MQHDRQMFFAVVRDSQTQPVCRRSGDEGATFWHGTQGDE